MRASSARAGTATTCCIAFRRSASARSPRRSRRSFAADRNAELLARTELRPAPLALDRERRAEARLARGAARAHLAAALRALRRQLVLPFLEVALREAAVQADGDPVAQRLAALFAEPVGGLT